jgi:hypothetical protein
MMSFTVVPLHNLRIPAGSRIPFGTKFVLQDVPEWLRQDRNTLDDIGRTDRDLTLAAKHALIAEYDADSLGMPDPAWKGMKPRSIQQLRFQSAFLANMAIWLVQPSQVCFTVGFHALTRLCGDRAVDPPFVIHVEREGPYYCHPMDVQNPVSPRHVIKAAKLFETLETVPRKNAVWAGLRAFSAALLSYFPDYRYPLFWQGLESLFGADNERSGITQRLCDRISFFLADTAATQQELSGKVRACYNVRSEIVHGRWEEGPEIDLVMADTEGIVRTVVRHAADRPGLLDALASPQRDDFLEAWVRSRSFTPPPFPT